MLPLNKFRALHLVRLHAAVAQLTGSGAVIGSGGGGGGGDGGTGGGGGSDGGTGGGGGDPPPEASYLWTKLDDVFGTVTPAVSPPNLVTATNLTSSDFVPG